MSDSFGFQPSLSGPAYNAAAITPSDTVDLSPIARGLYVGVTGDVNMELENDTLGTATLFKAMAVGFYPFRVRRVHATSTTATNLVAVY